jgi:hypothetical protein
MSGREIGTLLREAAPAPEPSDFVSIEAIVRMGRLRRARRRIGTGVVTIAIVGGAVGAAVAISHSSSGSQLLGHGPTPSAVSPPAVTSPASGSSGGVVPGPGIDRGLAALFDPAQQLLPGGRIVGIGVAASLLDYPLYLPAAQGLPPPEVWVVQERSDDGLFYEAAVRYDSDLVLTYAQWPTGKDPGESYQRQASDWHAGYVTTIAGHPAWVVPASENDTNPDVSVVHVSIDDVEITLLGRVSLDDLLTDASALAAA